MLKYNVINRAAATSIKPRIVYSIEPDVISINEPSKLSVNMVLINHGNPKDNRIFIVLAPNAFETPIDPSPITKNNYILCFDLRILNLPFLDMITMDIASGRHPPAAKRVKPRTDSDIPNVWPKTKTVKEQF